MFSIHFLFVTLFFADSLLTQLSDNIRTGNRITIFNTFGPFTQLHKSLFELADTWLDVIDLDAYVGFLQNLLWAITNRKDIAEDNDNMTENNANTTENNANTTESNANKTENNDSANVNDNKGNGNDTDTEGYM